MPLISIPLGDDWEDKAVPDGEYDLVIEDANEKTSKAGSEMVEVRIAIQDGDYPNSAAVWEYLVFPKEDDEERTKRLQMRNLVRFLTVFGIPFEADGFNSEDLIGATGRCMLKQEEYEGNVSNKLVLPAVG